MVINGILIRLRFRQPERPRPFAVPIKIGKLPVRPLAGLVFNVFMLTQLSWEVLTPGVLLMILGGRLSLRYH
jgi:hypothetical protein